MIFQCKYFCTLFQAMYVSTSLKGSSFILRTLILNIIKKYSQVQNFNWSYIESESRYRDLVKRWATFRIVRMILIGENTKNKNICRHMLLAIQYSVIGIFFIINAIYFVFVFLKNLHLGKWIVIFTTFYGKPGTIRRIDFCCGY